MDTIAGRGERRRAAATRLASATFALAIASGLAACSGDDSEPGPSAPAPTSVAAAAASPTPPPTPEFLAESVADLGELCIADEVTYHDAAFYRGAGPHPIAIFEFALDEDEYDRRSVPLEDHEGYEPEEPSDVALLACLFVVETGLSVGTCSYDSDDGAQQVAVDGQRFDIALYALATGEQVMTTAFVADFCPPTLIVGPSGELPDETTSTMNNRHLADLFDEYVLGTAG